MGRERKEEGGEEEGEKMFELGRGNRNEKNGRV